METRANMFSHKFRTKKHKNLQRKHRNYKKIVIKLTQRTLKTFIDMSFDSIQTFKINDRKYLYMLTKVIVEKIVAGGRTAVLFRIHHKTFLIHKTRLVL